MVASILPYLSERRYLKGRWVRWVKACNISLRDSTHLNTSHKGGRERRYKQIARLRNKCAMTCFGDMNQNIFTDKVYSLFTIHLFIPIRTFHFSLKAAFISSKSTLYSLTKLKHFLFLNDVTICILDRIDM